jgi:lysophospholipase L1-like esterase
MKQARVFAALLVCLAGVVQAAESPILVKDGQKIGFLGDSITAQGTAPSGYVNLVIMGLKAVGIEATAIPSGVSGNTSGGLLSRTNSVLDKGANWITINCGANDMRMVNENRPGGDLETYKKNVAKMVELAAARNARVVLITTTHGPKTEQIAPYNDFLRAYAKEKNLILADVNAAFREVMSAPPPEGFKGDPDHRLLADNVHPNQDGQTLVAKTVLLSLGVPAEDFRKIEKEWMENPRGKGVKIDKDTDALISRKQFDALEAAGAKKRSNARNIVRDLWAQAINDYNEKHGADAEKAAAAAQEQIGGLVDEYLAKGEK